MCALLWQIIKKANNYKGRPSYLFPFSIQDANDHDPIIRFRYFPATADFATVDENAQNGSVVAAVSVIDFDEGANGETSVEIRAGNELAHFRLEQTPSFHIVRVNGVLDREKISKYNLTIQATDSGVPARKSMAFLIIQVNDVNDHEPVFEVSQILRQVAAGIKKQCAPVRPPGHFHVGKENLVYRNTCRRWRTQRASLCSYKK